MKNACVAPSCPEIMAGVLPQLAPARMYLSALCSTAAAAPFSRCSLGSLSACIGHQFLDGRCTRIKKPTEAPWPFSINSFHLSTMILHDFCPFVSPVRSTMADTNRTGLVCFRRFFRLYPLFKRALMAAKAPLAPHRGEGSFFIIRLKLRHIMGCVVTRIKTTAAMRKGKNTSPPQKQGKRFRHCCGGRLPAYQ